MQIWSAETYHARVGDDDVACGEALLELARLKYRGVGNVIRLPCVPANLRENIAPAVFPGPLVDRLDEAIEGNIAADGDEDHGLGGSLDYET